MLIDIGVLDLFKGKPKSLIFPELKPHGRMRKLGGLYTVHFTEYRREIGVYEPGLDFHALRHSFVTRLLELEATGPKVARLVGHAKADPDEERARTTKRYTHFDIGPLANAVERLVYDGLDLSPLRAAGAAKG